MTKNSTCNRVAKSFKKNDKITILTTECLNFILGLNTNPLIWHGTEFSNGSPLPSR